MSRKIDSAFFEEFERRPVVNGSVYIDPLARDIIHDPSLTPLVESSFSPLVSPSPVHGRNAEDPYGLVIADRPIHDEFGNYFDAFSIKGSDAAYPVASYNEIEPSNVRVSGMLDASTFERCRDVSRELRAQGVLVEWPIYHARPKVFPDGEGDVGLLRFKYMIYDAYVEMQRAYKQETSTLADDVGKAGAVAQGLLDMQFGVMYRAMLSNIRISELPELARQRALKNRLVRAIEALQQRDLSEFDAGELVYGLNPDNPRHRTMYLTTALPSIMGQNLARFHDSNAYHKYLHPGNWSIAGEIVDLDSVRLPAAFSDDAMAVTTTIQLAEAFGSRHAVEEIAKSTDANPDDLLKRFNDSYRTHLDTGRFTPLELLALESHTRDLDDYIDAEDEHNPYILQVSLSEAAVLWYDTLQSFIDPQTDNDETKCQSKLNAASDKYIETLSVRAMEQITNAATAAGVDVSQFMDVELAATFEAIAVAKEVFRIVEDFVDSMVQQKHGLAS